MAIAGSNYEKQKIMIESLLSSVDLFTLCSNIIQSAFFVPELKASVSFILDYYEKYNSVPSSKIIKSETGISFDIMENLPRDEYDFVSSSIESFCKERAVLNEVLNSGTYIEEGNFGELVSRLESAVCISLQKDLGVNPLIDVKARIEKRAESRNAISTGMDNVDSLLGGGLHRTEMLIVSANSGGGKSVFLANLGLNYVKQGYDVLYVSLELSEDMLADRFETMITGFNKDEKIQNINETANKIEKISKRSGGSMHIKYMDSESNSNDIRAYIKEYELKYNKVPTLLIVDYLDIFGTNAKQNFSNVYDKDKISATELRAIGSTYDMVIATASQQNRSAINETQMNQSHLAGGLSKINTCDVYFSIIMTDAMRNEGVADFSFLKTRSSDGVGKTAHMKWDPVKLMFKSTSSESSSAPLTLGLDKYKEDGNELLGLMEID
jgi:KaiC/GvpD/RAD55 family RecA-like ATPase